MVYLHMDGLRIEDARVTLRVQIDHRSAGIGMYKSQDTRLAFLSN